MRPLEWDPNPIWLKSSWEEEETPEHTLSLSTRAQRKGLAICKTKTEASGKTQLGATLISASTFQNFKKINFNCFNLQVCGILLMAARADEWNKELKPGTQQRASPKELTLAGY